MSENQDYTRPVIPLVLAYGAGLILGDAGAVPVYPAGVVFLFGLFFTLRAMVRRATARVAPLLVWMSLGVLAMQSLDRPVHDSPHVFSYAGQGLVTMQGTVSTQPEPDEYRQTFVMEVAGVTRGHDFRAQVDGRLRVTCAFTEPLLRKGDLIEVRGRIKAFRNFYNPGGFDYERYMKFKGIRGRVYVKEGRLKVLDQEPPSVIDVTRGKIGGLIDDNTSSREVGSVLKALLIGQRRQVDPALSDAFNRTGASHLLAISGLHVGIVAGVSYAILVWVLSFIPSLLWNARVRKYAGVLALIPVIFYGLLSGMAPSTQRAVIMVSVILLTYALEADHDIINSLAWAALIILALSPGDVFGVSFQLSFAAVFFIVCGMGAVAGRSKDEDIPENRFVTWVSSYVWVSFFAYLGTLPLVLFYFFQMSVVALPANVVLVPLVGFLVVPLGLLGMFVYPLSPVLAGMVVKFSGAVLGLALDLVHWLAGLSFSSVKTVRPSILEIACYYGLLALILYAVSHRKTVNPGMKKMMAGACVLILLVLAGDAAYWVNRRYFHEKLRVTVLDVGQGSANLVEFPGGQCMMVDGGGFGGISTFDVGERVVAPFLWSQKIARVDTVVLSHPESDHLNGLLYILDHFHVKELWYNGRWRSTQSCERLKDILTERGIRARAVEHLTGVHKMGGADVRVLWPLANRDESFGRKGDNNDTSLVLKIKMGNQAFLFPGDIMERAEKRLVDTKGRDLESTVLLVPHHGSKTSSTERFIDTVHPDIALISAGYKNWFKMPHKIVLKRYKERGIAVYRTDLKGAILMETDGDSLQIRTVCE